jgi:hypothetical protein
VRVVDDERHGRKRRHVGDEPIEAVHNGERDVAARRSRDVADYDRCSGRSRPSEQPRAILGRHRGNPAFEQLADDPEWERRFELRAARPQRRPTGALRKPSSEIEDRRLPDPSATYDAQDAAAGQRGIHGCQLAVPLEQRIHGRTLRAGVERGARPETLSPISMRGPGRSGRRDARSDLMTYS